MDNMLLSVLFAAVEGAADVPDGFVEKLLYGLQVAVIGIAMVFAILAIIMGVLYLFELVFYKIPNKKNAVDVPVNPGVQVSKDCFLSDDSEIAAVIAAAVASYYEQSAPSSKYKIKSFRRIK